MVFLVQFWINLHLWVIKKAETRWAAWASAISAHSYSLQIELETVWLPIPIFYFFLLNKTPSITALMYLIVQRHSSKFQANCALFDTSMKLGTLIAVTITNIFTYGAKLEMNRFPWQPLFIKIPKISLSFPANTLISVVLTCFLCS